MSFLLLSALLALSSFVSCLDHVQYGAFTQTATYSVANQLGFFTANGLNVTYSQIPNSTYAYSNLLAGGYDILTGTIDNAVNLRFNQNKSVVVLGQLDGGPDLAIASVPNITSIKQLKGQPIMVDSATSGYAFVLRKVLSLYGLRYENGDYTFQVVGSTNIRYQYLLAGSLPNGTAVAATILTYPFTSESQLATPNTPNILARVSDFVNPLASSAFTIAESTLSNTTATDIYTRFLASFMQANEYLTNAKKQKCSVAAIAKQLNVSTAVARLEYAAATAPSTGETISNSTFAVNRQGLLNVIDIRGQFGGFANSPSDFDFADAIMPGTGKLIDDSIRMAAAEVESKLHPKC